MICGGVSLQGSYHNINQDNFCCNPLKNGYVMAVSDGLGSKSDSQYGSKAICESIISVLNRMDLCELKGKKEELIYSVHGEWKSRLSEMDISQCYATMLFCVVTPEMIIASRLGDGFLAVLCNGKVNVLFDKKDEYFANETDCFYEIFNMDKLEYIEMDNEGFEGAIACTDGIGIVPMDEQGYGNFAVDIIGEYKEKNIDDITANIHSWLEDWPGNDDKTIAFLVDNEE